MKKALLLFCIACCISALVLAQSAKYVILISIDGSRPDFYKENSWGTPNLHQLKSAGVYADGARTVFPSVTYPSHTTIITGAMPATHGVYYNERFDPNGPGRWYWEESLIKCPTLWDAVHKAGLTSAAVRWPVTVGAPIDHNFPEIWPMEKNGDRMAPVRDNTTPAGFFEEIEKNATGKLSSDDFNDDYLTVDENTGRIAAYVIRTYKPNLTAVHLVCVDHYEHAEGRDGPMVKRAVSSADRAVGKILEAVQKAGIKDSTAIIITGDHGFVDIHTTICPNVWLAKDGLLSKKDNKTEWRAIFHTSGASAFLHLKNKNDKKTLKEVRKVLANLPASKRKLFRIVTPEELQERGADPDAVLALSPMQGINMSSDVEGDDIRAAHGGTHGYYPDFKEIQTGFIGSGAGFNKGQILPVIGLEDIAPIITQLLHLDFIAPDGILYPGILKGPAKAGY